MCLCLRVCFNVCVRSALFLSPRVFSFSSGTHGLNPDIKFTFFFLLFFFWKHISLRNTGNHFPSPSPPPPPLPPSWLLQQQQEAAAPPACPACYSYCSSPQLTPLFPAAAAAAAVAGTQVRHLDTSADAGHSCRSHTQAPGVVFVHLLS